MPETFEILAQFLDRFEREVEGRELTQPPEAVSLKLQQFARGTLPEPDRAELLGLLKQNPEWLAPLAQAVKALRPAAKTTD
jgi:hypothetical protein